MPLTLSDKDLPAAFRVADGAAIAGQGETKLLVRWELRLAVVAAVAGVLSWRVGGSDLDVFAGIGTAAFAIAATLGLIRAKRQPEQRWYRGRAAAESAKTLAYRFAVGGDPFPVGDDEAKAETRLLDRLQEVVDLLSTLELPAVGAGQAELSPAIRAVRGATLIERKNVYSSTRIDHQWHWYADRAAEHGRSARRWAAITIVANVLGLAAGLLRFFGVIDVDLLGVAAAAAACAAAWTQLLQHRTLATSYALASLELGLIRERLPGVSDAEWGIFVSDAEDAISREHTLWLARRGHPRGR